MPSSKYKGARATKSLKTSSRGQAHRGEKLGQHFLIDQNVITDICQTAALNTPAIIEIGPGTGALTQQLLKRTRLLIAIERDPQLCKLLETTFAPSIAQGHLILINEDARSDNISSYVSEYLHNVDIPLHLFSNIPYYASKDIIGHWLHISDTLPIEKMTFLLQKEFSEKIYANPDQSKWGPIGVNTRLRFNPYFIIDVPPTSFNPPPQVSSQVVLLERATLPYSVAQKYQIEAFAKLIFQNKRKSMAKLQKLHPDRIHGDPTLMLDPAYGQLRPENLSIQQMFEYSQKN